MDQPAPVRGRFAPTPSGEMHVGNAFSALIAWLSARSQGGQMVLRMEDLDPARTSPAFARQIEEELAWLGLDWDEGSEKGGPFGPYAQSARGAFYAAALQTLEEMGLLYPCFCSRGERHAAAAPHDADGRYVYSGRCRNLSPQQRRERQKTKSPALRVRLPAEEVVFCDRLYNWQRFFLPRDWGDIILRRADGVFAYHLAVTADDGAMQITEVVRGRDLLASAACQTALFRLLGYEPPAFAHIPLILSPEGRRLSKRDGDLSLSALRTRLKTPERLIGALAFACGLLDRPEPLTARELLPLFSWDRMQKEDMILPREWLM